MPHSHPTVGHVHLRMADLDSALTYYRDVLGFTVTQRFGATPAFLGAGGYPQHTGLNAWNSASGTPPPRRGHAGFHHAAFLYPDRASPGAAIQRLSDASIALEGAADHGVSEAAYLTDPDGNDVELCLGRAPEDWPRDADGGLAMVATPLDVNALLAEARS